MLTMNAPKNIYVRPRSILFMELFNQNSEMILIEQEVLPGFNGGSHNLKYIR